ncbi:hypothetical protein E2C01_055057 [Portunus trituberculatus]|uniref:Uncharacterized protein n=1 Tax=Portunus trituberculatus TaxID=210409 RepID=A0A5B7GUA0_PORTR|nr:hypothetical protein [Portunus trituberculatus]
MMTLGGSRSPDPPQWCLATPILGAGQLGGYWGLPSVFFQQTGAQCLTAPLWPNKPTVLLVLALTAAMLPLFLLM